MKKLEKSDYGTYCFSFEGMGITGFMNSENTTDIYNPAYPESKAIPERYGFKVLGMGGGNTAWHQEFLLDDRKVYMLVTPAADGLTHEIEPAEPIAVGIYEEDGTAIILWEQANFPLSEDNLPEFKTNQLF